MAQNGCDRDRPPAKMTQMVFPIKFGYNVIKSMQQNVAKWPISGHVLVENAKMAQYISKNQLGHFDMLSISVLNLFSQNRRESYDEVGPYCKQRQKGPKPRPCGLSVDPCRLGVFHFFLSGQKYHSSSYRLLILKYHDRWSIKINDHHHSFKNWWCCMAWDILILLSQYLFE